MLIKLEKYKSRKLVNLKKRKGEGLAQVLIGIAVMGILLYLAMPYIDKVIYNARYYVSEHDATELKDAVLSYKAAHINGETPENLATVVNGLSADNSLTGQEMKFISSWRWTTNGVATTDSVTDAWGEPFVYTISSTSGKSSIVSNSGNVDGAKKITVTW